MSILIDRSTVFFFLPLLKNKMDKEKSVDSKIAKFESDLLKTKEDINSSSKSRNFTDVCMVAIYLHTNIIFKIRPDLSL